MLMERTLLIVISLVLACNVEPKTKKGFTEKDMKAYLMVYFKDETHGLYMAGVE